LGDQPRGVPSVEILILKGIERGCKKKFSKQRGNGGPDYMSDEGGEKRGVLPYMGKQHFGKGGFQKKKETCKNSTGQSGGGDQKSTI